MRRLSMMRFGVVLGLAVFFCGCSRRYNVLPTGDRVHSEMWTISGTLDELERAMRQPTVSKREVVRLLERVRATTLRLREPEQRKKHATLEGEIDGFADQAELAMKMAKAEPPNYYFAGKLSGACIHCHDPKGGVR